MIKLSNLIRSIRGILQNIRREHIGAFAAQSAFFLIMSFLPMVFLVFVFVGISNIGTDKMVSVLAGILADVGIHKFPDEFGSLNRAALVSLTTVLMAWSAGKSFKSLTEGFHSVLHIGESRNYILQRLRGLVYALLFAVVVVCFFIIGVFGDVIHSALISTYLSDADYNLLVYIVRRAFVLIYLFGIVTLIYRFVPDWKSFAVLGRKRVKIRYIAVGSLLSSLIICAYTVVFSYYVQNHSNLSDIYGNLTTLICVMLWLYASMYILILGFRFSCYLNKRYLI